MNKKLFEEITKKKEYSKLPKKDVEKVFENFDRDDLIDEEKVKKTREMLHKIYSSFVSDKLLKVKDKDPEWILRKHLSTRERLPYYEEVYEKLLGDLGKEFSVIDLGAGINGFSYEFMQKFGKVNYIGVEAVGQLVELMNYYFKTRGLHGGTVHESLFELDKIKKYVKQVPGKKIVFLFKVIDNLEMLEKDYSKKLLKEIVPMVDKVVVSFATRSMGRGTRFKVSRKWILDFIEKEFNLLDDFEIGGERYVVFRK